MWEFIGPIVRHYAPVLGRYIAVAAVGVLAAGLNRLNIGLDPATSAELTASLAAIFAALVAWAVSATKKQTQNIDLAGAVRASATVDGAPMIVTDPKTGDVHEVTSKVISTRNPGKGGQPMVKAG